MSFIKSLVLLASTLLASAMFVVATPTPQAGPAIPEPFFSGLPVFNSIAAPGPAPSGGVGLEDPLDGDLGLTGLL
ncbi:hypothetical protein SCHPADRAFT_909640 [Schizopora paradoxa]|uniref:Uncharacterized protein n=1 Tax=Schizopora paradoxa TaxID=27342 RepID=A0A0H2R664_9AGAM|nr:hypothetical protein SCHPADRAFT_909640 [Schizopora paradoxa]